jgi:cytochrome b561
MGIKNTFSTYGSVSKFLHWLIFLLLIFMFTLGFCFPLISKANQPLAFNVHKLTGLTILVLMVIRALWALMNVKPLLTTIHPALRIAAHTVHRLLYLLVIVMPIMGWIGAVAGGRPPHIGSWQINLPIEQSKTLSDAAFNVHNTLAFVILAFVAIHVGAACYHYFIKKDDILQRMLP